MAVSITPLDSLLPTPPHGPTLLQPCFSDTLEASVGRPFSMAFQPIVDVENIRVIAYEALVRGNANEPASSILFAPRLSARIDRACSFTAIEVASSLGILDTGADLCINVNPRAAYNDIPSLSGTIAAAERSGLPLSRLVLEITEVERLRDPQRLQQTLGPYRDLGLRIAIDDFGSGFAGLSLLAAFHPDILKIDIALTRDIHERYPSRVIVKSIAQICRNLDVQLIAEGVEEARQVDVLQDLGIRYMQGHYFAEPAFEALPVWPA